MNLVGTFKGKNCLYILVDKDKNLLYIGQTSNPEQRFKDHYAQKVFHKMIIVKNYTFYRECLGAEIVAIDYFKPVLNILIVPYKFGLADAWVIEIIKKMTGAEQNKTLLEHQTLTYPGQEGPHQKIKMPKPRAMPKRRISKKRIKQKARSKAKDICATCRNPLIAGQVIEKHDRIFYHKVCGYALGEK